MEPSMIETDRCVLNLLCESDIDEAIELFIDPEVRRYLGGIISKEEAVKKLYKWIHAEDPVYFCVRISTTA